MQEGAFVARNVLEELERVVKDHQPSFSTERGNLFVVEEVGMGAIKLNVSLEKYLNFISSQPKEVRPKSFQIGPSGSKLFQVVVMMPIYIEEGIPHFNGKEIVVI